MSLSIKNFFKFFIDVEPQERLKVFLLTVSFFFIIGGYTIIKDLKDSIFVSVVGGEYYGWAKLFSTVILIPAILFYSKLVDVLRRHHLLYFYSFAYGLGGLVLVYFLGHPVIGLSNTDTSPYRLFGWFFYFFFEGYSPFVVSVFWAFTNSITSPEAAKRNYTVMVAGSKLGGMVMAGFAWWLLRYKMDVISPVASQQILLGLAVTLLLFVPIFIYLLIKHVPGRNLHGYEAAYQIEKKREKEDESEGFGGSIKSMLSGLILLVRYPYVMGIFGTIFFWEVINVVFQYLRLGVGRQATSSVAELSGFLLESTFFIHMVGFFIVLFGTRGIINFLGERRSLIFVPTLTGVLLLYYLKEQSMQAVLLVYVIMRSINYAFAYPLRESLYIPTTKDMKFKSKSWIDAFGTKVAKGCGGYYTIFAAQVAESLIFGLHIAFFSVVISLWIVVANLLGRRFERAVARNEVIGAE